MQLPPRFSPESPLGPTAMNSDGPVSWHESYEWSHCERSSEVTVGASDSLPYPWACQLKSGRNLKPTSLPLSSDRLPYCVIKPLPFPNTPWPFFFVQHYTIQAAFPAACILRCVDFHRLAGMQLARRGGRAQSAFSLSLFVPNVWRHMFAIQATTGRQRGANVCLR